MKSRGFDTSKITEEACAFLLFLFFIGSINKTKIELKYKEKIFSNIGCVIKIFYL